MQEIRFASYYKQYLIGRLFSIKQKKARADQSTLQVSLLCANRKDSQIFKSSNHKKFSPVCMLQMQLASMNIFYSIR